MPGLRMKVKTVDMLEKLKLAEEALSAEVTHLEIEIQDWQKRADKVIPEIQILRKDCDDVNDFISGLQYIVDNFKKPAYSRDLRNLKRRLETVKNTRALMAVSKDEEVTINTDDDYFMSIIRGGLPEQD